MIWYMPYVKVSTSPDMSATEDRPPAGRLRWILTAGKPPGGGPSCTKLPGVLGPAEAKSGRVQRMVADLPGRTRTGTRQVGADSAVETHLHYTDFVLTACSHWSNSQRVKDKLLTCDAHRVPFDVNGVLNKCLLFRSFPKYDK